MADGDAPTQTLNWRSVAAGVAGGAVFAFCLYVLARYAYANSGLLLFSVLLIPPAACALAVVVAGARGNDNTAGLSAIVVGALLLGSAIVFREGAICIAMAAPVFFPLGLLGGYLAKIVRGSSNRRTPPAMVIVLPLLMLPMERPDAYPTVHSAVVTTIEIAAPLDDVWREAIEIRSIDAGEQTWTVTHNLLGVARPADAHLIQRGGQLVRAATWRGNIRFYEIVTTSQPGAAMAWTFDIPEEAADRMLDEHLRLDQGYLQMQSGRYDFEAITPTRTRLTLTTNYAVRTPLNAYATAWGQLLLGDIHTNVLHIVARRAEQT